MNQTKILIKVPATSANLGPGFDSLGLALDLWNEAEFMRADHFSLQIQGEGTGRLGTDHKNLIVRSMQKACDWIGQPMPVVSIRCLNRIPLGAGLGSSAAAVLTGLLAANQLVDSPMSEGDLLKLAAEIEHHPDNAAPALMGGLVASIMHAGRVLARPIRIADGIHITVVTPQFDFPTSRARSILPTHVLHSDAVHNVSRAVMVTQALERGDLELLGLVMDDSLHQPYRLPLIPGARQAMDQAKSAGAAAVALSGAGPSLIAFSANQEDGIGLAMKNAFQKEGMSVRIFDLRVSRLGAQISSTNGK